MHRILMVCLFVAAVGATSCGTRPASSPVTTTGNTAQPTVAGTIRGISDTHGNAYTSITADRYASLGLSAGARVRIVIGGHDLTLPVVKGYTDVPVGTAMAVLHREGLTLAIRDGNFIQAYGVSEGTPFALAMISQ